MSKAKTIYVVTSGEYSDYNIHAVFLNRQMAEQYIAIYTDRRYDKPDIEEWKDGAEADCIHADVTLKVSDRSLSHFYITQFFDRNTDHFISVSTTKPHERYTASVAIPIVRFTTHEEAKKYAIKVANERLSRAIVERDKGPVRRIKKSA